MPKWEFDQRGCCTGIVAPARLTSEQLEGWGAAGRLPQLIAWRLGEQVEGIARLKCEELALARAIEVHNAEDALAKRLLAVPGIGPLGASALSAELWTGAKGYANGRQYAACKGLAPRA